ncbi:ATP-binding protein [Oceanobacillus sp. J11TS1]|uniref:ATP-binding protein n=1 Tax=Oceanobacillus sp. J11TS1 TaxID=2807191 RepID=UPI001B0CE81B|nr:FtsK/SpoIIIE domain-containing protein [Oceanobacillus sp. J11TS1]GIO22514.1 hypothetical protein J11TS1_10950 [Oceanobacillus sp. J11TS1]
MFSILTDLEINKRIKVALDKVPHYLIVGNTGTGKTTFSLTLLGKIGKYYPNAELYLLDFKGDDAFLPFSASARYYTYTDCEDGLAEVHERFSKRLSKEDESENHIIIFFDELSSFLNYFDNKKDKELQQRKIAEMLMMGRSKNVNVIVSLQRPDAELLKFGSRNQFTFKLALGNNSSETRKMVFPSSDVEFKPCTQGFGYVSLHDNSPKQIATPVIKKYHLIKEEIQKLLSNGTQTDFYE